MNPFGPAAAAQLAGGIVRPAIFFRTATDPVVRLWAGIGDIEVAADLIETDTAIYKGIGDLGNIPALQQLINGTATRVDFTVSGIGPTGLRLADEDAPQVRGRTVNIGFRTLDKDWQPSMPMAWVWEGESDVITLDSRLDGDRRIETLTLSVGSLFTGRRRPRYKHYTDQEQRRRSPDDRLCDRVNLYSQAYTKTWPRF